MKRVCLSLLREVLLLRCPCCCQVLLSTILETIKFKLYYLSFDGMGESVCSDINTVVMGFEQNGFAEGCRGGNLA